ncbi:MAG: tryptophanase, partial [Bacteroidales bacterium]|nr:tryptophanase [Bacteroidales bacterium]
QPVSMKNIREVKKLADQYNKLLVMDAARFAENAWFIKTREKEYANRPIREILLEMCSFFDAMTMSAKKDGIVNIGGMIALKDKELYKKASTFNILFEGYLTYGGLAGRDLAALAQGLRESSDFDYLESRMQQVTWLGTAMKDAGIPLIEPFGGHALFIDALRFYPEVPREQFPAQTLVIELYLEGGIRSVEIGTLMADRDPVTRENRYPKLELVRLALPRRVYTQNHLAYVAAAVRNIKAGSSRIKTGYRIVNEAPILRHFTVELEPVGS